MSTDLALPLAAVFISVALAVGSLASMALARTSPVRRRLQPTVDSGPAPAKAGLFDQLFGSLRPATNKARQLSKTPEGASSKMSRLQRRMELAGWTDPEAAGYYALAEMVLPIVCGLLPLALMGTAGWLLAVVATVLGYLIPDMVVDPRDTAPSEGDPKRVAGRHRSDCRLRRGRIEPRPGDHARE